MQLFYAPGSPFVRKVLACAISREIEGQITLVPTNLRDAPSEFLAANPLGKIPCLLTVDGVAMFDSPVICEYLDSIDGAIQLFPRAGRPRWRALKQQAIGDGIMDAAVMMRAEQARPADAAHDAVLARQQAAIDRTLAQLERDVPHQTLDIGSISIACALGYLDFRFADTPWRPAHPQLAAWFATFGDNPGLARTVPRDAG